ncbi:delta 9-fatty acid desaturase protein [Roridomyces roridus]|uniref:Acyl-CoA desaturase n=1 Tax=Roridomyces roridus TaxID=1738132 RepID=A0AAD7FGW8_9AGAR|nr:delta 9-fatty acid desaturase protein [Roridomyces roridus]
MGIPHGQAQTSKSEDHVSYLLRTTEPRPPVTWKNLATELQWVNVVALTAIPVLGIVGACHTKLRWETGLFAVFFYYVTGLGITAGYHRYWSHRSYKASTALQWFLALAGAGAAQGSIKWWSRGHRAHHRYTDTKFDPYNAAEGFWHTHIGWIVLKPRIKQGSVDISDLASNFIVEWQHKHLNVLIVLVSFVFPTIVSWLGWGDARGGLVYAGLLRQTFLHHSIFCLNSLAHWLGESPFDDKHSPRDHFITALVTLGEGYHNFHHQFPMDYQNGRRWYQYDPTKWFIWGCGQLGLASHLKVFPENEVRKGQLTMQLKRLRETQDNLVWPVDKTDLPVINWEAYQSQAAECPMILISGFIHDVSDFIEEHPGGARFITKFIGKDATAAFFGGVYEHSNAAHNLLSMKRVGVLHGGVPHILDEKNVPPSQRLRITRFNEPACRSDSFDEAEN